MCHTLSVVTAMKKLSPCKIGDIGECSFQLEAIKRGFIICKPYGSAEAYDFILDTGKKLFKVQVKAGIANTKGFASFRVCAFIKNLAVTKHRFNILACFDIASGEYYLIPSANVTSHSMKIGRRKSKLTKYKNNWAIFK